MNINCDGTSSDGKKTCEMAGRSLLIIDCSDHGIARHEIFLQLITSKNCVFGSNFSSQRDFLNPCNYVSIDEINSPCGHHTYPLCVCVFIFDKF